MTPLARIVLAAATLLPLAAARAADVPPCRLADPGADRPRIALVLGGGGARGIAHIAVIKELERLQVPIDCIAGTSMGSLVGGLYASGMPIADIETLVRDLDWEATLDDSLSRPERSFRRKRDDDLALLPMRPGVDGDGIKLSAGLLAGERVLLLFERATAPVAHISDFDRLPIPYRAVATDINTGRRVVLGSGSLPAAMRASMSIPGAFRPMEIDGHLLVDGGIIDQVPVDVAREMGADIVIAVDVGTPLMELNSDSSVLALANQLTGLLTVYNTERSNASLGPQDLLIRPDLGDRVSTGSFEKGELALQIGAEAVAAPDVQARLVALARPGTAPEARVAAAVRRLEPSVIDFVRIDNHSHYADEVLLSRLDLPTGVPLDVERLEKGIYTIYGLDTFDFVTYDVIEEGGRSGVVVTAHERKTGPRYLEAGLTLTSDFSGDLQANLRAGLLFNPINPLGGELRLMAQFGTQHSLIADWYQPLDVAGDWFAGVRGGYDSPIIGRYDDDGHRVATYAVPGVGARAYGGRTFGTFGALTLSLERIHGRLDLESGSAFQPEESFDVGQATLDLTFDRLDSLYLPRDGYLASLAGTVSDESLGADADFTQVGLDVIYTWPMGRHSGMGGLRWHETVDGIAPFQSQFRLGGITHLAGVHPNELATQNYRMAFVGYNFELASVLGRPAVVGATLEYAELWPGFGSDGYLYETDGSVYFAFDSWLGRLIIGYGQRSNGDGRFFLELGKPQR